nr:MAG TPA: hypothetical protein [Microviridae sp.]
MGNKLIHRPTHKTVINNKIIHHAVIPRLNIMTHKNKNLFHLKHLTISGKNICLFVVIINKHKTMGIETMHFVDTAMFQIIVIRAVVANQTRTHKKITSY